MPSLEIKPPEYKDFEVWSDIWRKYNAFYGRQGETALDTEVIQTAWARLLDPAQPIHCLLARHEGRVIGFAHFIFHQSMISVGDTCYLQDLFTEEPARGLGIGRRLILAVANEARLKNATGLYWHTHVSNLAARRLYDKVATDTEFVVYRMKLS